MENKKLEEMKYEEESFKELPVKKIPVYYVGNEEIVEHVKKLAKSTTKVKVFKKIPGRHMLIVDGSCDVESKFLKDEIRSGVPVVTLGNTKAGKNLFKKQFSPSVAVGKTPDGKYMEETAFGYIAHQKANTLFERAFLTCEENAKEAAKYAYMWAAEAESILSTLRLEPDEGASADCPYWCEVAQLDWTSGDAWKPYGRLNVATKYLKLYNDSSGDYDWYCIQCKHQSVPGISLGWGGWCTADLYTWIDADYYKKDYFLSEYQPTTTSGTSTVGVNVGVTAGSKGSSVSKSRSWSYSIPDVNVVDNSDFSLRLAKWCHDVNEAKSVGQNTYLAEPGACIRISNGGSREWREHYGVRYGHLVLFWWQLTGEGWVEFHI